MLFTTFGEASQIALLDLESRETRILVPGGSHPRYMSSEHIVYGVDGTLRAVGFDLDRLEVTTSPVPVLDGVITKGGGAAEFSVSDNGSLLYVPGTPISGGATSLVIGQRDGTQQALPLPPHEYAGVRVSPDGLRIALDAREGENDIWIWDIERQGLRRLTIEETPDQNPVWTPDGKQIVFNSVRSGTYDIYRQAVDGTGTAERLTDDENNQWPDAFSPDGRYLVFGELAPETGVDLMMLTLETGTVTPLVVSEFTERNAEISPDGRWLAYQSNKSGRNEVYVRTFPEVDGGEWQISTTGGINPLWSPDGRELFYIAGGGVIGVAVESGTGFEFGTAQRILDVGPEAPTFSRAYDIMPDGQRFVFVQDTNSRRSNNLAPIHVVVNWFTELERLVPTN